ncbi:T9SS type A sorting domain-containing protein [Hanstruepera ponticola]|uniref:T9SS type A sorting domain-containing protein n=1 Tax=Hanstruepera ponticola TaxID=2042995 RepID=UPI000CF14D85|nr:T9SS type A sorting domain-containing protein [Hanstruepera ponticola]
MKKITLLLALISFSYGFSQTLNQNASWPNANWTVTGSYNADPTAFEADPTTTSNFAFDDDDAGDPSDDDIAAESPVIDLTSAFNNSETAINVNVDYTYNDLDDTLTLEYWDATNSVWVVWDIFTGTTVQPTNDFCAGARDSFTSSSLLIGGFDATQLSGFRYRIYFQDDAGAGGGAWEWGFCFDSPTIVSSGCSAATFTLAQGTNNCPADEFFINVDITDLGTATTVNILNDGGAAAVNGVDLSGSPYSVGPFPAGTDVTITVEDAANSSCNATDNLTTLASCPPNCATAPITPLDGATDVDAFANITLSWTAPASGPAPDNYDIYVGTMSDGSDQAFFSSTTDTFFEAPIGAYDTTIYWSIIPSTLGVEATGCSLWSFTSASPDGTSCLNAPNGQWPGATYDIAASGTCDGTTSNEVVANGWTGEYSLVTVVDGETYIFESSVGTDFVTIGSEDGTTAYASGEGSATWTADLSGNVRFYLHNDTDCNTEQVDRIRSVICGVTLSTEDFLFNDKLFTYYPNPVSNNLTIQAQKNIQNVTVYNMLGQEVLNNIPNTVESTVDMSNLKTGAYFVKVTIDNKTETIRVIRD